MSRTSFLQDLLATIFERTVPRLVSDDRRSLEELAAALISERGEASGTDGDGPGCTQCAAQEQAAAGSSGRAGLLLVGHPATLLATRESGSCTAFTAAASLRLSAVVSAE